MKQSRAKDVVWEVSFTDAAGEGKKRCAYNAYTWAPIVKFVDGFQVGDITLLEYTFPLAIERPWIDALIKLALDLVVHSVNKGLINLHAFCSQVGNVVNWNLVQFRMVGPVLVQNQKELLSSSKRKDRHQDSTPSLQNTLD